MIVLFQYLSIAAGIAALVSFVVLVALYRRKEARENARRKQAKADIADMTILFQTMRDIIKQQKELARDFNAKLDGKMAVVKQILAQGMERNKELYEKQQALSRQLEEAQDRLGSLQRQLAHLRDRPAAHAPLQPAFSPAPPPEMPLPQAVAPARPEEVSLPRAPVSAPHAGKAPGAPAAFADWADFDLEAAASDEEPEEEPFEPPEAPEDPQAARNAFRALLDLERPAASPPPRQPGLPGQEFAASSDALGGNGGAGGKLTPLQRRVVEYRNAGMSVTQIAQELGIGKGEVRLMLSLLKQKP